MPESRFHSATPAEIAEHYGPDAAARFWTGTDRGGPQSWLAQHQTVTAEAASRWFTQAVYRTKRGAELYVARREAGRPTLTRMNLRTGERHDFVEQPVSAYRVVTLLDLFGEGAEAVAAAIFDLATSDHEWFISSELGSAGKMRLLTD